MHHSRSLLRRGPLAAAVALLTTIAPGRPGLEAQGLKIAAGDFGIGIGHVPRIDGLRINFRDDHRLERVRGINVTLWSPNDDVRGDVTGLAVGLPLTGARNVTGLALAGGVGAHENFRGVGIAPLGIGAGNEIAGVVLAGIGAGTGNDATGVVVGGLGVGTGSNMRGIAIGGLGAGVGNSLTGIGIGGLGLGVGNDLTGVAVGGVGVGAGNSISGVAISLGGVGAGNRITGVSLAGLGIGAGNHLKWVGIAGLGVGSPRITGFAAAAGVGGEDVRGVVLAPLYFRIEERGRLTGLAVSAFNDIQGAQHGLVIGLLNITDELHGVQIGLINIARNKDSFQVLPLVNYHR
ncbi:MAG: hypothetical protein KY466_13130 [Gemmatimonadetes bacterium]|nr:hypothetical protein [Gemmatimonadota bacterium]